MNFDEYQQLALRTENESHTVERKLINAALGLTGEGGEFADAIKKWSFHHHPLDEQALAKELGDILWYIAIAAKALDIPLSEIATMNIKKLRDRYPDGFSTERSLNR